LKSVSRARVYLVMPSIPFTKGQTGQQEMRTEFEPKDIERIADMVVEKLIPLIQDQQPKKALISIDRDTKKENRNIIRERKPRMLSVRESAGYLGIAEKTLRNRSGAKAENPFPVKSKHIGGKVLFDVKDLDAYLDKLPTT
jgi:hypothetical protein